MSNEFDAYNIDDITIKSLILDDLAGYVDILNEIDQNMLDRQASIVTYEIYKQNTPIPIPLLVKKWIALHTVLRLIPALETYVAQHEIRSDVQREGYLTYYDQLAMLRNLYEQVERRIVEMRNEVQIELTKEFSAGPPRYDTPKVSPSRNFVTDDPFYVGSALFPKSRNKWP